MSVIKTDESQLKKEQEILRKRESENTERAKYLEMIRNSRKFQKYVMKEIIEKSLNETFSLDNLPIGDDMEKMGQVSLQYVLARQAVNKIIKQIKP